MNFKKARELLEIQNGFSLHELKKKYHMKALKTHPDKCIDDPHATEKFKEVNDAYEYLLTYLSVSGENIAEESSVNETTSNSYNDLLFRFLNIDNNTIHKLVTKITQGYNNVTVSMFQNMEKDKSIELYNFIVKYKEILHIDDENIEKIKMIIKEKVKNDNIYILNPSIEDLFNHRIFKLKHNNDIFYVPLWHSELQYSCKSVTKKCDNDTDNGNNNGNNNNEEDYVTNKNNQHNTNNDENNQDINVICVPELDENIKIDENNNVHIRVNVLLDGILTKETVDIYICDLEIQNSRTNKIEKIQKIIKINVSDLKITKYQTVIFKNEGIATININDSYNIDKLSDVYVYVSLI